MMKSTFSVIFLFAFFVAFSGVTHAQENGSSSAELQQLRQMILQKATQDRKNDGPARVGILGTITKVGQSTFTLQDLQGKERTVEVPELTPLIQSGKNVALKDLTINSGAAVLGDLRDELIVEAKRVLLLDQPPVEKRTIILGTITRIDRTNITITRRGSEEQITVPLTTATRYEDMVGLALKREDVEVDQSAIIVTALDKSEKTYSKRVHLLVRQTDVTSSPNPSPAAVR